MSEDLTARGDARVAPSEAEDATHPLSAWLGLRGVVSLVFGIVVLLWPDVTVLALALVFAAYVVVDGIGMVVTGLGGVRDGSRRWWYVLAGVVGIVAGVIAALWPAITALALVVLVGAWAVVTGAMEIAAAVRARRLPGRWVLAGAGVISLIAGVIILVRPDVGAIALATVLGSYAVVVGLVLLWAARQVRKGRVVVLRTPGGVRSHG
jgi:uncharacterized membrane protein HdeD (DUF308 family)